MPRPEIKISRVSFFNADKLRKHGSLRPFPRTSPRPILISGLIIFWGYEKTFWNSLSTLDFTSCMDGTGSSRSARDTTGSVKPQGMMPFQ